MFIGNFKLNYYTKKSINLKIINIVIFLDIKIYIYNHVVKVAVKIVKCQ